MKCSRLKAACTVALMLLSLVGNLHAYGNGNGRLWTRFSERMTSAALSKLPPSLAKKIVQELPRHHLSAVRLYVT